MVSNKSWQGKLEEALRNTHSGTTLEMYEFHRNPSFEQRALPLRHVVVSHLTWHIMRLGCRMAINVDVYLKMHRIDLADRELKNMQQARALWY